MALDKADVARAKDVTDGLWQLMRTVEPRLLSPSFEVRALLVALGVTLVELRKENAELRKRLDAVIGDGK